MLEYIGPFGRMMLASWFMMLISFELMLFVGRNKPAYVKIILGIIIGIICGLIFNYTEPGWFKEPIKKILQSMVYMVFPTFMLTWYSIKAQPISNQWKKRKSAYIYLTILAILLAPYMVTILAFVDSDGLSMPDV